MHIDFGLCDASSVGAHWNENSVSQNWCLQYNIHNTNFWQKKHGEMTCYFVSLAHTYYAHRWHFRLLFTCKYHNITHSWIWLFISSHRIFHLWWSAKSTSTSHSIVGNLLLSCFCDFLWSIENKLHLPFKFNQLDTFHAKLAKKQPKKFENFNKTVFLLMECM